MAFFGWEKPLSFREDVLTLPVSLAKFTVTHTHRRFRWKSACACYLRKRYANQGGFDPTIGSYPGNFFVLVVLGVELPIFRNYIGIYIYRNLPWIWKRWKKHLQRSKRWFLSGCQVVSRVWIKPIQFLWWSFGVIWSWTVQWLCWILWYKTPV